MEETAPPLIANFAFLPFGSHLYWKCLSASSSTWVPLPAALALGSLLSKTPYSGSTFSLGSVIKGIDGYCSSWFQQLRRWRCDCRKPSSTDGSLGWGAAYVRRKGAQQKWILAILHTDNISPRGDVTQLPHISPTVTGAKLRRSCRRRGNLCIAPLLLRNLEHLLARCWARNDGDLVRQQHIELRLCA